MRMNPMFYKDFYKAGHPFQYPKGTDLVYSNFTPRSSRVRGVREMTFFGLQYILQEYLITRFDEDFFRWPLRAVVDEYADLMQMSLGGLPDYRHVADLHQLGYLPLRIKALPEGTAVPLGTPALTLCNTRPEQAWLPNGLETLISALLWKPCTSATTARLAYGNFRHYAQATGAGMSFVPYQGHDFSLRGMSGMEDGCMSGAAHLLFFQGTDTVPAIPWLKKYYGATGAVGVSVPATEHSVMSAGGDAGEFETIKRLLTEVYPTGIVSIVSDTWDFWQVVTKFLPELKEIILRRPGKLVIRPDSGVPHKIVNGDPAASSPAEQAGLVEMLWRIFGGTTNSRGYRELDTHIGFIYGDGIDLSEQVRILAGLQRNQFATSCGVLGLGSYMYQYVTRDTYGTVCKATYCEIDGQPHSLFKSPKTGAWKKSHKGLLRVNSDLSVTEDVTWEQERTGLLRPVFEDGRLFNTESLKEIQSRCLNYSWPANPVSLEA